jgi:hypothetical protein
MAHSLFRNLQRDVEKGELYESYLTFEQLSGAERWEVEEFEDEEDVAPNADFGAVETTHEYLRSYFDDRAERIDIFAVWTREDGTKIVQAEIDIPTKWIAWRGEVLVEWDKEKPFRVGFILPAIQWR